MTDQDRVAMGTTQDTARVSEPAGEEYGSVKGRTQREIVWRRFRRHRLAMIGGIVLILLYGAALLTPVIAPYEYDEPDFAAINQGPSLAHPMGADRLGRDELTRVLYGGRVSLMVGLGVGIFSTAIGAAVGILAGYYGRRVDTSLMALTDYILLLPLIPLLLVAGSIFRFTPVTITFVLVVLLWGAIARLTRGQVLSLRDQEYVLAAKAVGVSDFKIMVRHVLPNVVGVLVVQATLY
ncbi:MAG: ABC transporter permease, partial [Rubrobacteraceae bacterium]